VIRLLTFLAVMAAPAGAETARVISGEHPDFTRLVIELPTVADWTVGKTPMGYAFATRSAAQPTYDLSIVWNRIPRTRLQALSPDLDTGALYLTLACRCHLFPFEYRPGMIVLDIKEGLAPAGSTFEQPFEGVAGSPPEPFALFATVSNYNWLNAARAPELTVAVTLPLETGTTSLDPLRDELLEQLSRGAAEGVVDMRLPGKAPKVEPVDHGVLPWAQIRIGEMPGLAVSEDGTAVSMMPDGGACIADDALDLPAWGADRSALDLLVEARSGLFGEFDAIKPEAILHAVRLHLYLGFGAEAAQYAVLLQPENAPVELAIYRSMARLIEGSADPQTPFAGMLACDGTVALWAALAYPRLPEGQGVKTDAILRSFLALPTHLRGSLGPGLAERLRQRGDVEFARIIRDTLARTPYMQPARVALLDAAADLQAGRLDAARAHAEAALAEDGSAEALVALVETHFRSAEPLAPDIAEALRAFQGESEGQAGFDSQRRALVLALALSGQTDAAFADADADGDATADLWQLAHRLAGDDTFLRHAVVSNAGSVPQTSEKTGVAVAERLVGLGFSDAALLWLGGVDSSDPPERRRVAARAELARGDARRAVALLDGLVDLEDEQVRALALVQLGALPAARQAYDAAGMPDEALRLLAWEKDWPQLQSKGDVSWSAAAGAASPMTPVDGGPLARGAALLEDSASARAVLGALLSSVAAPYP